MSGGCALLWSGSTTLNYFEHLRHEEPFCMSLGRFDCTEHSPTAPPPGERGMLGGCALVRGGSTVANNLNHPRNNFVDQLTLHGQPFCKSLGRLDYTEPSPTAQGEQGVLGGCALVRGGSTALNQFQR